MNTHIHCISQNLVQFWTNNMKEIKHSLSVRSHKNKNHFKKTQVEDKFITEQIKKQKMSKDLLFI